MFGSHLSIAGGMHNALLAAEGYGMETVQVFTSSPSQWCVQSVTVQNATKNKQQWAAKPLDPAAIRDFRSHADRLNFQHIVAHDSYLINLAAPVDVLWEKSIAAFAHEMERCDQLAIPYLVTHPGAHVGSGEAAGIDRVIAAMIRILRSQPNGKVTVCLETTAGQGSTLGASFDQLAAMLAGIDASGFAHRVAICVDTCHILAAGYDLSTEASTAGVLADLNRLIGLSRVKAWHFNDSKKPRASRVDRHEHIGRGHVGLAAFRAIVQHPATRNVPKILETPKDKAPNGEDWDTLNLAVLRALAANQPFTLEDFTIKVAKEAAKPRGGKTDRANPKKGGAGNGKSRNLRVKPTRRGKSWK
jgi:deoxyribonuclease-4